jgi:hypothetical protein
VEQDDLATGYFSLQADTVPIPVAEASTFSSATEIVKVISTVLSSAEEVSANETVPSSVSADLDSVNSNKNSG